MTNATTTTFSTTDTATTASKPRDGRLPARFVLAAITLLLAGGGWYGYQRVKGTAGIPMATAGDFLPDYGAPRLGFNGRVIRPAPPNPDGVNVLPGNVVIARAGGLTLRANGRGDGKWALNFTRAGMGGDRQAIELVDQARRRILDPRKPASELKITDAQQAALAAMPVAPPELAADAYARAIDLLGQLTKLPANDAKAEPLKKELEQIVATASKSDVTAIAKEYAARAVKIRATLSADQVATLLDQRPAAKPAPATRPAGK